MATLTGKITDVTGRTPESISSITVKAPAARIGSGTDVIVSSPATVDFNRATGDITISGLTGGLSWLYIEGDGWSDSIPLAVAEGMITLVEAIANAAGTPGLVDLIALLMDIQSRIDAIAQDAVDGAVGGLLDENNNRMNAMSERFSPRVIENLAGTEWAHATEDGYRLPLGYTGEGRLDAHAVTAWQEQVNNVRRSAPGEYIHAAVSESGHLIWGVKPDGTVVIPGLDGGSPAASREKYRMDDGTLADAYADDGTFVGWGSSSLSMMEDQFTSLLGAKEITYMNRARGGERIEHIAARMGAVPSMINPVTIPASGRVAVSSENVRTQNLFLPYAGTLAGIHGTLSVEDNQMYFTRSNSGSEATLSEATQFIPDDNNLRGTTVIISAGKNDLGINGAVEHVLEYTDTMVKHLTPLFPRVLVMGHFMDQDTPIGGLEYLQILKVNAELERRYGDYFFDHLAAFAGEEIWERTGITPTAQDLQQQQDLRLPPSLATDNAHATRTANNALVPMIGEHMARLGWI